MSPHPQRPDQPSRRSNPREELETAFSRSTDRSLSPFQLLGLTEAGSANQASARTDPLLTSVSHESDSNLTGFRPGSDTSRHPHDPSQPHRSDPGLTPVRDQGLNPDQTQITATSRRAPLPPSAFCLAQCLARLRDPSQPSQTLRVSQTLLSQASELSTASIKRGLRVLQEIGAVVPQSVWGHAGGGTVYELTHHFAKVLQMAGTVLRSQPLVDPGQNRGHDPGQNRGHPVDSSSSSSSINQKLLQPSSSSSKLQATNPAWLILEGPWTGLDHRSLTPYLSLFTDLETLQDFLDRAAAAVEAAGSRIKDPLGFLFACLRRGYVNAPPEWKSRRLRAAEEEIRRLTAEVEETQRLAKEQERLRLELFRLSLPPEERQALEAKAARKAETGWGPRSVRFRQCLDELTRLQMGGQQLSMANAPGAPEEPESNTEKRTSV
jgi:hypothetical protein